MTWSRQVWITADSAVQDKMRANAFRLAIAYHDGDADRVVSLVPQGDEQLKLLMGALTDSLYALNQIEPPGTPESVWERVTPIVDVTAPREVRSRVRGLMALIAHSMRTAELGVAHEAEEGDPSAAVHLYSAIMAMRVAENPGGIDRMREKADTLDPPK